MPDPTALETLRERGMLPEEAEQTGDNCRHFYTAHTPPIEGMTFCDVNGSGCFRGAKCHYLLPHHGRMSRWEPDYATLEAALNSLDALLLESQERRDKAEWQRERAIGYWNECSYAVRSRLHAGQILDAEYAASLGKRKEGEDGSDME